MLRLRVLVTVPYSDPPACRSDTCHRRPFSSEVFRFFSFGALSLAMIFVFARLFFVFPFGNSFSFSLGSFRKKKKKKRKKEKRIPAFGCWAFSFSFWWLQLVASLCACNVPILAVLRCAWGKIASLLKCTRSIHMLHLIKLTKKPARYRRWVLPTTSPSQMRLLRQMPALLSSLFHTTRRYYLFPRSPVPWCKLGAACPIRNVLLSAWCRHQ